MTPADDVLSEAARAAGDPVRAALATVIRVAGSAPRRPGASMIVFADGRTVGTVGGGRMERDVIAAALPVARTLSAAVRWRKHLVRDLAMCCGGEMEVWIEPLDERRGAALGAVVARRDRREASLLVTNLGARGGKEARPLLVPTGADETWPRPLLEGEVFLDPVLPPDRVVIFGAGHIGLALARAAHALGFLVAVCDEDDDWASAARFADTPLVPSFDASECERALAGFGLFDHVVIVTRDHATDQKLLEALLPRAERAAARPLGYLGMVGSRGKLGRFRRRLDAKGIGTPAAWSALHSPAGVVIGAETPEEIALAIAAEIVAERARRHGRGREDLVARQGEPKTGREP